VDPRRAGLASKADHWLRVRPGTDAALALSLTHVMIEHGWFDGDFVRRWTNAPLLVRADTGRFLRASELSPPGDPAQYVAWDDVNARPVQYDPACCRQAVDEARLALFGAREVSTSAGSLLCRPAFDLVAEQCRRMAPAVAEVITGVPAADIERAAQTLWESRPVAFYTWSGLEQRSNTTQIVRAIDQLYALTGSFDAPGGNVLFAAVPTNPIDGVELLPAATRQGHRGPAATPRSGPLRVRHRRGLLRRRARRPPVPRTRARELRRQPGDGPRRQQERARRARRARLLRPRRPVPQPDRRAGRHRCPGDDPVRGGGPQDRVRDQPGGPVAGPAARATRTCAR
jgi:anaerobic selenocysteine-containing dehydrogenase